MQARNNPVDGYAELHCKSNFSFLEGAAHPAELVERAAELGYQALAITDRHSVAGVVRAHTAAKQVGLPLLIGAEIAPVDASPVVLLAMNRRGYGRLCRLLTLGRRRAEKGQCQLLFADVAAHADDLLACAPLVERDAEPASADLAERAASGSARLRSLPADRGDLASAAWQGGEKLVHPSSLHGYREVFGDRLYALAELHQGPDDEARLAQMLRLAEAARLRVVAAGDVHFHTPQRQPLCDVLHAVRHGCTVAEAGRRLFPNAQRHLKPLAALRALFAAAPELVARTVEVAARCRFSLDELRYEYPEELVPTGRTPAAHLEQLTWEGARQRWPEGVPERVRQLLVHELRLIAELNYEAYFLTIWDLVRFARGRDILCQGRGSAANSAVCYCLGITSVDPDRMDVLFERFISRERNEPPDIDVDFEHERREEVLQYLYEKYGRERAGMTAEVITYCVRSAVRDVGKALGLSLDRLDVLARHLDGHRHDPELPRRLQMAGLDPQSTVARQLLALVDELAGFPRHLSQHVGGMVLTQGPLCELVPIENAAMEGRTVIQWNKDDLDELGILKVDCLALGMLTALRKCFALVERHAGRRLSLAELPEGDQRVYDMICRADTVGVFQIESRAQMSMLPRLRPRCFYDLVIEVAIVRPGPIQGNMVHPYLRRRAGEEAVSYPSDALRQVLEKTLGVPLFQEQAMRLAVVAAGFTPGEADQLRRAMAAWRRPGLIEQFQRRLIDGMRANGLTQEFAEVVFRQIRGFGEYGFPESHATSFALLVYASAWLKHYYPAAFAAAVINSQPMGFYAPAQLVRDARAHGVEVRPVDVTASDWDCTLEPGAVDQEPADRASTDDAHEGQRAASPWALRLGLRLVAGLSEKQARAIETARRRQAFASLDDLVRRARLPRPALERLAEADALRALAGDRRQALWRALGQAKKTGTMPLLDELPDDEGPDVVLPGLSPPAEVAADYRTVGLSLRSHPLSFYRRELDRLYVLPAERLATWPTDRPVSVAGLVLVRQHPSTAKGIIFITLEDETGVANLVIHPSTWQRHYRAGRTATVMLAQGRLERRDEVIHVIVSKLEDLTRKLPGIPSQSRDFR
ncbi:MAG: error-prone DNA polymerase [Pirellulales bacterium]|nr:error-prone DNA polymerase [Pirellulales bacterium]